MGCPMTLFAQAFVPNPLEAFVAWLGDKFKRLRAGRRRSKPATKKRGRKRGPEKKRERKPAAARLGNVVRFPARKAS